MCEQSEMNATCCHVAQMDNNSKSLDNVVDVLEYNLKKETILLLKQKMCKTHDLIKQYTEKMKENDDLKTNLDLAKKETKNIIFTYKSAMDKTKELELKIAESNQKTEDLTKKINEYKVDVAASEQTIQQLHCKIKTIEEEHSSKIIEYELQNSCLKEKVKNLEQEIKKLKMNSKRREKEVICTDFDTAELNIKKKSTSDIGINVAPMQMCDSAIDVKPELQNKNIMTDEFYSMKDDPYPLFCSKCEARLTPTLLPEKIYKTMSVCPKVIESDFLFSPTKAYLSPCLPLNSNSTSITENVPFKTSMPCLNPFNDSAAKTIKPFQSAHQSTKVSTSENVKLNNIDIAVHLPTTTYLPDSYSSNPAILASSKYINSIKKDLCSDDLLTEHSSSFKNVKNRIETLESKVKKLQKINKRLNTNLCNHHVMNCNNDSVLDSHLVTAICKGIAEYYDKKNGIMVSAMEDLENVYNDSEKHQFNIKRKRINEKINLLNIGAHKKDSFKTACCQVEDNNKEDVDTLCDNINNSMEETDITQPELTLHVNTNNSMPDENISSYHNDTCKAEEEGINEQSLGLKDISFHLAEAVEASVDVELSSDNSTSHLDHEISHFRSDEPHTSDNLFNKNNIESIDTKENNLTTKISPLSLEKERFDRDLFNKNNVESIDTKENNLTATKISLLSLEKERFDRDTTIDSAEATKRKKKSGEVQDKSNRLLKKIRNLKKKTRENIYIRTRKSVEMCSDDKSERSMTQPRIENKNETESITQLRIEDKNETEQSMTQPQIEHVVKTDKCLSANNITGLKRKLTGNTERCTSTKKPKIEKEREDKDMTDSYLIKNTTRLKRKFSQTSSSINEDIEIQEKAFRQQSEEPTSVQLFHNNTEESHTLMSQLIRYIDQKSTKREVRNTRGSLKKMTHIHTIADKFVQKQLERLINSDSEDFVYSDVIEKLNITCGPRIIAKGIVTFISRYTEFHNEVLDKSFTPPAPLMMPFEQKIIMLLNDLKVLKPTIIYFVQMAIEYALFKHNSNEKILAIESLTRIYVGLARIQKDREKVRIMCCNALYCILSIKSMVVLYTILTCWSEVLPRAETNKEILPKCIAFLISMSNITNGTACWTATLKKLKALISKYYEYDHLEINEFVKELITILQNKRANNLDTAIIIIARRQGSSWTYKNIIECDLLPMIINSRHPCIYSAFSLLGKLLHAFPLKDDEKLVHEISEQLRDIIQSGKGSDDQQEGIISALLSLSRHRFDLVASSVIKWIENKPLRSTTIRQLQAFLSMHEPGFWKLYLQKMHIKSIQNNI